jgi:hypothetical protein
MEYTIPSLDRAPGALPKYELLDILRPPLISSKPTKRPWKCLQCRKSKKKVMLVMSLGCLRQCVYSSPDDPCHRCVEFGEPCGLKQLAPEDRDERDIGSKRQEFMNKVCEFAEKRLQRGDSEKFILSLLDPDSEFWTTPPTPTHPTTSNNIPALSDPTPYAFSTLNDSDSYQFSTATTNTATISNWASPATNDQSFQNRFDMSSAEWLPDINQAEQPNPALNPSYPINDPTSYINPNATNVGNVGPIHGDYIETLDGQYIPGSSFPDNYTYNHYSQEFHGWNGALG